MKGQMSQYLGTSLAEIKIDMWMDFGVDVSYTRSWEGKELSLEEIHESWEEGCSRLPFYMAHLLGVGLGEWTCLVREADVSFQIFL